MPGPLKPVKDDLDVGPMQSYFEEPTTKWHQTLSNIDMRKPEGSQDAYEKGEDYVLLPRRPAAFRPEPFVNDPLAQQVLHRLLRKIPSAQDGLRGMIVGPNGDTVDRFKDPKGLNGLKNFLDYDQSNLLGTTNMGTGNISLNPRLVKQDPQSGDLLRTLSHELMHTAGYGDQTAYKVGDEMFRKNWRKK